MDVYIQIDTQIAAYEITIILRDSNKAQMQSLKPSRVHSPWQHLSKQLVKSQHWQLVSLQSSCCLFKNRITNKTYQFLDRRIHNQSVYMPNSGLQLGCDNSERLAKIFLDVLPISEYGLLAEKACMSLSQKISLCRSCDSGSMFGEQEVVNTFMPILESVIQGQIPSLYSICCQNIIVDQHQQIRLRHPLLCSATQSNSWSSLSLQLNYAEQISFCILECTLLLPASEIAQIMVNEQEIMVQLVQKQYSTNIIGLVLLLTKEKIGGLCWVKMFIRKYIFNNQDQIEKEQGEAEMEQWFTQLQTKVNKLKQTIQKNKESQILKQSTDTMTTTTVQSIRRVRKAVSTRFDDDTEDSQHQILAKYRSGKRIITYRKINQIVGELDEDFAETKPRRRRVNNKQLQ